MYSSGPARSDLVLVICGPWHPCGRVGRHKRPCFDDDSTFACQPKIDPILAPHKTCLRSVHVFCHRLRDEHISFAYCAVACDAELHRHHDPHGTRACDSAAAACHAVHRNPSPCGGRRPPLDTTAVALAERVRVPRVRCVLHRQIDADTGVPVVPLLYLRVHIARTHTNSSFLSVLLFTSLRRSADIPDPSSNALRVAASGFVADTVLVTSPGKRTCLDRSC